MHADIIQENNYLTHTK